MIFKSASLISTQTYQKAFDWAEAQAALFVVSKL